MIYGWSQRYGVKPIIEGDFDYYKITFYTAGKSEKLGKKVTERVTEKVTENQRRIMELMRNDRYITTKNISAVIGMSERKVKENISKLKKKVSLNGSARQREDTGR